MDVKKEDFSVAQWYYIEEGMKCKFDVSIYADPQIPPSQMSIIFNALLQNVDLSKYKGFRGDQLSTIALYATVGEDVTNIANKEYSVARMSDIMCALERGIKILPYCGPEFDDAQLHILLEDLKHNYNVSMYADPAYSAEQMLTLGLLSRQGYDISGVADPSINPAQMMLRAVSKTANN